MSKPVKNLITDAYKSRFEGLNGAVVIDIRGIESNDNNTLRAGLAEKQIKVSVVKNSLARRAFKGTDLEQIGEILDGPSAMVYPVSEDTSVVSVARELIDWAKKIKAVEFKGALMEGIVFGADEIDALSKYPTREEAQAQVVQLFLSPAQNLVGSLLSPGRNIAGLVDAIKDKLEKGEEINKAG